MKEEQTASYSVEIWKRYRKWGGIPTGITQNVKDLLSSREVENIFENSDFIYMLNQAAGDRQILAKQLNISPHQLSYVTHSGEGEGLLFYGNTILPFIDHFPKGHRAVPRHDHQTARGGVGMKREPRLQFSDADLAEPKLEKPIKRVKKAEAKADKAQAKIPKKTVIKKERGFDPATGKVKNAAPF